MVCSGSLITHHSDPPTFWVDVEGGQFPCGVHDRYRFLHEPDVDRLLWFLRRYDEKGYTVITRLRREGG